MTSSRAGSESWAACSRPPAGSTDDVDFDQRDYYQVRGRLGYQLSRDWTVEATYSFTRQDYKDTPGEADRNEAFLSVNYQPRGRAW
jgi:hypothetical protein